MTAANVATAGTRRPNESERAKELSFLYPLVADFGTTAMLFVFAVFTASLTLLSEAIRSILMLGASLYGYFVLRAMHRDRLRRFEFGVGKIEQFVSAIIGLGLVASGLWVARSAVDAVFSPELVATPLALATAAVINAVNTTINFVGWYGMKMEAGDGDSEVFRAQLAARFTMMASSFFLQFTLTVAALARDPVVAHILDAAGATFVAGLMLANGSRMAARAFPTLLDAPARGELAALIRRTVEQVIPPDEVVRIRTRRTGYVTLAEVTIAGTFDGASSALHRHGATIEDALRDAGAESVVSVILATGHVNPVSGP